MALKNKGITERMRRAHLVNRMKLSQGLYTYVDCKRRYWVDMRWQFAQWPNDGMQAKDVEISYYFGGKISIMAVWTVDLREVRFQVVLLGDYNIAVIHKRSNNGLNWSAGS